LPAGWRERLGPLSLDGLKSGKLAAGFRKSGNPPGRSEKSGIATNRRRNPAAIPALNVKTGPINFLLLSLFILALPAGSRARGF